MKIAFSGSCFSGKTYSINKLAQYLDNKCIINHELIRSETSDISKLRRDPVKYLDLQIDVIKRKAIQDLFYTDKTVLIDRSLIDSLFYYIYYVDKNSVDIVLYNDFLANLLVDIQMSIKEIDHFILCSPYLQTHNTDPLRPPDIDQSKHTEYQIIKALMTGLVPKNKLHYFNPNTDDIIDLYKLIII